MFVAAGAGIGARGRPRAPARRRADRARAAGARRARRHARTSAPPAAGAERAGRRAEPRRLGLGCAPRSTTSVVTARERLTPTIDELAAGGVRFDQAISAAPWTAPSTASMVTGLYPHRHGYLHWDVELDPALPTLFTVAAAYGYETGSFVFDERYLFSRLRRRERRGHERAAGRRGRVARGAPRPAVLPVVPQLDDAHALRGHHPSASEWRGRRRTSSRASSRASRPRSTRCTRATANAVERESETSSSRDSSSALDDLGLREQTGRRFVADHGESWGERFDDKRRQGTYHMHGATSTTRSSACR